MGDDLARTLVADTRWKWAAYTPVIEAGESGMRGCRGVVLPSVVRPGQLCVRWAGPPLGPKEWSETSITHGTVPDLDHDGAAGVILGMLGPDLQRIDRRQLPGWDAPRFTVAVRSRDGALYWHRETDTSLGRAAARAWLASGVGHYDGDPPRYYQNGDEPGRPTGRYLGENEVASTNWRWARGLKPSCGGSR